MADRSSTRGADYVFQGIMEFYKHKELWKYAVPSLLITLIVNIAAVWFLMAKVTPYAERYLDKAAESGLAFIIQPLYPVFLCLIWLTALIFLSSLSYGLFEAIGCFSFAQMVARYENEVLHCSNAPLTMQSNIRNIIDSFLYSTETIILTILLSITGFFLPILMELAKAFAIGYRYAVSYASESGFNRDIKLQNLPKLIPSSVTASFGVTTYFIQLIPFLGLFLIPGFFIGGAIMVDREIP